MTSKVIRKAKFMIQVKPPHKDYYPPNITSIFLADSIEMGAAELWQDKVCESLKGENLIVYNPRRDNWDSSLVQSKDNKQFKEQVDWELDRINASDIVFFYFDPNTKSPITLLELGYVLGRQKSEIVVTCPDGFWRKGNVEVLCDRYGIKVCNSLEEGIKELTLVYNFPLHPRPKVTYKFAVGDMVSKVGGDYRFDGTVVSVFDKISGLPRYVVEDDRGILHIYNEKNLTLSKARTL